MFNVVLFQCGLVKLPLFVFLTVSYQEVVMKQMLVCLPLQLLTVNPEHRFSSLSDMQTSAYLADVDWYGVHEKKMEPGFVPNVSVTTLEPVRLLLQSGQTRGLGSPECLQCSL